MEDNSITIKRPAIDLSRFQVISHNRGSARGDMLDKFLEKLNPGREALGLRPYNHARLSQMLQHIQTKDLHAFFRQCETAKIPFSAFFHWSLKPKGKK